MADLVHAPPDNDPFLQGLSAFATPALLTDVQGVIVWRNDAAAACLGQASAPGQPIARLGLPQSLVQAPPSEPMNVWVQRSMGPALHMAAHHWAYLSWTVLLLIEPQAPAVAPSTAQEWVRRFDLLAGAVKVGYWSIEPGAPQAIWSAPMAALYGLPPNASSPIPEVWLREFVHPDDAAAAHASLEGWLASAEKQHVVEFRARRTDGRIVHLRMHSHREGEGAQARFFGVALDITAERQAEQARRDDTARRDLVSEGIGVASWECDLASGVISWDKSMWHLRGREPKAKAPNMAELLAQVDPRDRERVRQTITARDDGLAPSRFEYRVLLPDGQVRWIESRSIVVHGEDGEPLRRIGVNWDTSHAHQAEEERSLKEANAREVQAKSQLMARISHELRTPLNAILGFTDLLLSQAEDDPAARRRQLEHIRQAGQHLLLLVNDVLELSGLQGGEVAVGNQAVALDTVAQAVAPMVALQAKERGVALELIPSGLAVMGDATRLQQVLLNLLSNAIKFNRVGGSVRVSATRHGDTVRWAVQDSGCGMSRSELQHIFEPFVRGQASARGVAGSGIGMSIVKALVERMGGHVAVQSSVGEGSCITVTLRRPPMPDPPPLMPALPSALTDEGVGDLGSAGGAAPAFAAPNTVLYIEDNPVNTVIVQEIFARMPHLQLLCASTGAEGLALAQRVGPALVLLDMELPDLSGEEVLRRMRSDPALAQTPCVALTANAMPEDSSRALSLGLCAYWTKPLDVGAFQAALDAHFGRG